MRTIANDNLFEGSPNVHAGSKLQRSAGLALSWLAVLFLLFDTAGKLLQVQPVIDGTPQLGYLGGAVATHVRVQNPSALLWGGLILRDARLRALLPIRRAS